MIELSLFDAGAWTVVIASVTTFIVVPLTIRYGTPDKENN